MLASKILSICFILAGTVLFVIHENELSFYAFLIIANIYTAADLVISAITANNGK